jgi:hypothetical protein
VTKPLLFPKFRQSARAGVRWVFFLRATFGELTRILHGLSALGILVPVSRGLVGSINSAYRWATSALVVTQQTSSDMQGLASVFIALSLLLSPLTSDPNAPGNGLQARQEASAPAAVTATEDHDAMSIRQDNSQCPFKYPDINSKAYCECVVGRSDNFVCNVRSLFSADWVLAPPPYQFF